MAPRTVRRTYGVLRAILNYAVDLDLIVRSPCHRMKLPAAAQERRHVIDAAELAALASAVGDEYRAMVYLGAVLGLRWGECAGLRVGRLDVLRSTLTVAEQITRGPKGAPSIGVPKSNASRRTLQVPDAVMSIIAAHLLRRGITAANAEAFVFTSPSGGPLDYAHFRRRVWLPACSVAGLRQFTFHDLRRANATAMVVEGTDLKTAQTRLGHSDPRLTLAIYAQATTEADRVAADRLAERFMGEANALASTGKAAN